MRERNLEILKDTLRSCENGAYSLRASWNTCLTALRQLRDSQDKAGIDDFVAESCSQRDFSSRTIL